MRSAHFDRRFFESSRGKIVTLLRTRERTVNDLAEALELTDNAIRAHLLGLERDGLVMAGGTTLRYHDPRRFGAMLWIESRAGGHPLLDTLGIVVRRSTIVPDLREDIVEGLEHAAAVQLERVPSAAAADSTAQTPIASAEKQATFTAPAVTARPPSPSACTLLALTHARTGKGGPPRESREIEHLPRPEAERG